MSNELVPSSGGALIPASTGGAVVEHEGEHVGDISRESAPSFDWSPRQPETVVEIRRQMLRDLVIDGIGEQQIESWQPVFQDHAPAMREAFRTSNRQELARLTVSIRDELLRQGLITTEQLERVIPILQRYHQESERALIGPGARNGTLIDEMRDLDSLMAKPGSRYWKGEDAERLQRRWRELYDQGVRADGERSTADSDVGERIEEIEALMDDSRSEYYRGSNADALQREYRDLIGRRERAQHNGK